MSCIAVTSQSLFFMQGVESFIKQRGAFCNSKKKEKPLIPTGNSAVLCFVSISMNSHKIPMMSALHPDMKKETR